jgi:hypothetical protein
VQVVNNTTEAPFTVYVEYANFNGNTLAPPPTPWKILTATSGVTLSAPRSHYPTDAAIPAGATPPYYKVNDAGSATWQILEMPSRGDAVVLQIPDFPKAQAWSFRPLKNDFKGNPCTGRVDDCGMPILIESGKKMVGDMSAADGVNFLLCYELTTKDGPSKIDFKTNPCAATGQNPKGCTNPSVDGIFDPDLVGTPGCLPGGPHCWKSAPCPAGTCNLAGASKLWCDAINDGQCSTTASTWPASGESGGPKSCTDNNLFTTYCYSHSDAPSSPYFADPYKMKLVYSDLDPL